MTYYIDVLLLDDDPDRTPLIQQHLAYTLATVKPIITVVRTVDAFRKAIDETRFDLIFLDHDLGTKETGYEAAQYLVSKGAARRPIEVGVHSMNLPARRRVFNYLCDNGIVAREINLFNIYK